MFSADANGMDGIDAGEANGIECNDDSRVICCARCIARGGYGGNGGFAVGGTEFGNGYLAIIRALIIHAFFRINLVDG